MNNGFLKIYFFAVATRNVITINIKHALINKSTNFCKDLEKILNEDYCLFFIGL